MGTYHRFCLIHSMNGIFLVHFHQCVYLSVCVFICVCMYVFVCFCECVCVCVCWRKGWGGIGLICCGSSSFSEKMGLELRRIVVYIIWLEGFLYDSLVASFMKK